MKLKRICLYHSSDFDGKASAAIVRMKFPDVELYPINYGDDIPWDKFNKQTQVIMVDFSLQPYELMHELKKECGNLIWIDHHISAMNDLKDLECDGIQDCKLAGCELTWQYFFPDTKMPKTIELLGRYDVWNKEHPKWESEITPFQIGFKIHAKKPDDIISFLVAEQNHGAIVCDAVMSDGRIIKKYEDSQNASYANGVGYLVKWEGYLCYVVNKAMANSALFDSVTADYDVAIAYCDVKGKQYTVSLYSMNGKVDVSGIANKQGGGGHKGAAGFQCKYLPWLK